MSVFGKRRRSTIEVRQTSDGQGYYFRLINGDNGDVQYSSEVYPSWANAERGARDAKQATRGARIVRVR